MEPRPTIAIVWEPCGQEIVLHIEDLKDWPLYSEEDIDVYSIMALLKTCSICEELKTCKHWNKRRIRAMRKDLKKFEKFGFKLKL